MVLTNKDIDLKPSFVNILICLVRFTNLFTTFSGGESSKKKYNFLEKYLISDVVEVSL